MPDPIGFNVYMPAWKNNTRTWFDCKLTNGPWAFVLPARSLSANVIPEDSLLPLHPSFQSRLIFPHFFSTSPFCLFLSLLESVCLIWLQQLVAVLSQRVSSLRPPPPDECRQRQKAWAAYRNTAPFLPALPCASAEERVTYRTGTSRLIVKGKKNHTHTEWGLAGLTCCISLSTKIPGSRAEAKRGRARACFFPVCVSLRVCFSSCHGLCFLSHLAETRHGCPGLED